MIENYSFALLGLQSFSIFTHGLRRGLHSYAASRLGRRWGLVYLVGTKRVLTRTLKLGEAGLPDAVWLNLRIRRLCCLQLI